jgi:hypothetical protein
MNKAFYKELDSIFGQKTIFELLKGLFNEMKANDSDNKLSKVSSKNLKIYSLEGVKLDMERTLDSYCTFSADLKEPFKFILDFEDVIIIRLLGGAHFIYAPINDFDKIKTALDIKDKLTKDAETMNFLN